MTMRRILLSLAILGLSASSLFAQQTTRLFLPTERPGLVTPEPDRAVLRSRRIRIDLLTLQDSTKNQKILLPLFQGQSVVLVRERQETPRPKTLLWYGAVDGQPGSSAILSSVADALAGDIVTRDGRGRFRFYQIRFLGDGVHVLNEIDQRLLPPEDDGMLRDTGSGGTVALTCDSASTIDVLVAYTGRARVAAGNTDPGPFNSGIEAEINEAVASANEAYAKSGIDPRLNLVHMEEVSYSETGKSAKKILEAVTNGTDGLDAIHHLRDQYGADVVAFIVGSLSACGRSNVMMSDPSAAFESQAFAVIRRNCSVTRLSFAHELGHVMGARHEWGVDGPDPATPSILYNHGFIRRSPTASDSPWRTIMAVDEKCLTTPPNGCSARIPRFSNPLVSYPEGSTDSTGVEGGEQPADNRTRLNDTSKTVANFRCSLPTVNH